MNTKHTPGPWSVGGTRWNVVVVSDKNGNIIAYCPRYGAGMVPDSEVAPWHNAENNARLIASAPELLSALKSMMCNRRLIRVTSGGECDCFYCKTARAAIAKAEQE